MVAGKSILVVDDDKNLANLLERILVEEGYQVVKAYDGNSALTVLEEQRPDLIILDIIMPGMDGLKALDVIRRDHDVPVIMLTAKRDAATVRDAFTTGADDYIRKPFRKFEILARVKAKLRRS